MSIRRPQPPAPFAAPTAGSIDERLAAIAVAINGKASANVTPAYHSLALIDDTGQTWRLKVHADGTLHTDLILPP